ncbi:MAG: hypothetical protein HWE15_07500 [Algoriphagus sp.]|uniref:DUF6526 family protein n=1 Tax=Algoriphagus sp. TaxID=1872435 RepID=UPI0017AB6E03|nr:DUF6526 family protein [Algoriphagus sp.]NVJ86135.1 hypothetical protein [Algoriphagus sp.]
MEQTQNFKNHTRYFPFHHFILTPLTLVYFIWTIVDLDFSSGSATSESIKSLILAFIIVCLPLLARIYALKNQNRIIFAEMRARYAELRGRSFSEVESKLSGGQIIALRFASDEELIPLVEESISNNLSSKEIKMKIKNWRGDYRRV